ncbi:hypothetical protein SPSYN_01416 [Sporotomaculum syntrophicum]|uniref:Uncharacterized protein n=1 Tax=Sporotomaculum syntrophicum TaxID=182264 RepID=A0A9D2WQJ1_9FIRM|nr:CC/Se motif family (seleno)protein [Sporotomaculum syntrophicum]KAF1085280.1 hypothetical protein SPSYN_01416 [Sporotomaculum syntrophicum]
MSISASALGDLPIAVNFDISEDAKAYILAGYGCIIVEFEPIVIGCGGFLNAPAVHLGFPLVPENYNKFMFEGITIYTPKGYFGSAQTIKIILDNREGYPTLQVHRIT